MNLSSKIYIDKLKITQGKRVHKTQGSQGKRFTIRKIHPELKTVLIFVPVVFLL